MSLLTECLSYSSSADSGLLTQPTKTVVGGKAGGRKYVTFQKKVYLIIDGTS